MRLNERKLAIFTGLFFAAAMTNIAMNGDRIVANLAKMAERPGDVALTSSRADQEPADESRKAKGLILRELQPVPIDRHRDILSDIGPGRAAVRIADARGQANDAPRGLPSDEAARPPALSLPGRRLAERLAGPEGYFARPPSDAELDLSPYGIPCAPQLDAGIRPGALVEIFLEAACHRGQRIEIRHAGLVFATRTSALGSATLLVPVLEPEAVIEAVFPNRRRAAITVSVPEAAAVDRVAVQWRGPAELVLHALEFGAVEGGEGHVWPGAPRSPEAALRLGGGFLLSLGDGALEDPARAQVYTLPHESETRTGTVRLVLEATGGANACATEVSASTLRREGEAGAASARIDLRFELPPCGEPGQTLLLRNVVGDLKIARR